MSNKLLVVWTVLWFLLGCLFFVAAGINTFNGENDRALGEIGIALACHARCEVKILQQQK